MYGDADFAARETMLRSTSGVAEFYGRSPIEFGSSTQSVRALSTGESEFHAITKGSAHSLHSQAILKGFGVTVEARWNRDRIKARVWASETSPGQVALGAGESLGESAETTQASNRNQYC